MSYNFAARPPRDDDEANFFAAHGSWASVTPLDACEILAEFTAPWWIAGGWAIDAFTETHRDHDDIDIGLFREDIDLLHEAVARRYTLWSAGPAGIQPLAIGNTVPNGADQVWLREDAQSPWLLDVVLTSRDGQNWVNRRHPSVRMPLTEATWMSDDGIRYLRVEHVESPRVCWRLG